MLTNGRIRERVTGNASFKIFSKFQDTVRDRGILPFANIILLYKPQDLYTVYIILKAYNFERCQENMGYEK